MGSAIANRVSMTLEQFDAGGKYLHPCPKCTGTALSREYVANNNGHRVFCTSCGTRHPWGTLWLKQSAKKRRKDDSLREGASVYEVWERFKNRCSVCTLPSFELLTLGIGLSRHHVTERYDSDETDCPIVPVCNACKTIVDARQRESWRWVRRLRELSGESDVDGSAGVPAARLPRHPLRPEREAAACVLEGLPADDADA